MSTPFSTILQLQALEAICGNIEGRMQYMPNLQNLIKEGHVPSELLEHEQEIIFRMHLQFTTQLEHFQKTFGPDNPIWAKSVNRILARKEAAYPSTELKA